MNNWKEQRERKAFLALEDGSVFYGYSVGADKDTCGEVVFSTDFSGYQEILSAPSNAGRFIVMAAPEIGNCGVNSEDVKDKFFAAGFIVRAINEPSNWRSEEPLQQALVKNNVPAIAGVDTRALTLLLREKGGVQKSFLCTSGNLSAEEACKKAKDWIPVKCA